MKLSNVNLNLYKYFYVVSKSKSYSEASKKLYISKTAISKDISQLEKILDVQLFYREKQGVKLTDEGKELYKYVEERTE